MNTADMSNIFAVLVNGQAIVEYDRSQSLPAHQRAFLDKMDGDMDEGFTLGGEFIADPDQVQRAQFVAINLVHALKSENDALAAASCAYLASRLPELRQLRADDVAGGTHMDLVFDEEYRKQVNVSFDFGDTVVKPH